MSCEGEKGGKRRRRKRKRGEEGRALIDTGLIHGGMKGDIPLGTFEHWELNRVEEKNGQKRWRQRKSYDRH